MPTVEGPPRVDRRAAGKNHGRRIRAQHCGLNMTRPRAPPWRTAAPALPRGFGHPALGAPFAHHLVTSSSSCHPSLGPVHSGASHRVHMSRRKRAKPSARTSVTDGRPMSASRATVSASGKPGGWRVSRPYSGDTCYEGYGEKGPHRSRTCSMLHRQPNLVSLSCQPGRASFFATCVPSSNSLTYELASECRGHRARQHKVNRPDFSGESGLRDRPQAGPVLTVPVDAAHRDIST
jgi:hypothetical protein